MAKKLHILEEKEDIEDEKNGDKFFNYLQKLQKQYKKDDHCSIEKFILKK